MEQIENKKIGVLIPQSNTFPLMGKAFLNGLKLALVDFPCDFIVESIGFGSDAKQLLNSYQKLSFQNNVDLTTGLLGHHGFEELVNFASQNEEVLIAADLGGKKPFKTPHGVFQNSLGLYDGLGALIPYFESKAIKRITSSTCYYEAGYDFIESLSTALELTKDIEFSGHYITPLNPREEESKIMAESFNAMKPQAIVAFHNALYSKEHAQFLSENGMHIKFPIYALPFSNTDELSLEYPSVFEKIMMISSWYESLNNKINQKFIADYQNKFKKTANYFALLGYENGLVIKEALSKGEYNLIETIEQISINGPRGPIFFNKELNRTEYTNYLWENVNDPIKGPTKRIIETLKNPLNMTNNSDIQEAQSGWFNAYLCH